MSKLNRGAVWVFTLALILTVINIAFALISGDFGGAWNEVGWLGMCLFGIAYIRSVSQPYSRPE